MIVAAVSNLAPAGDPYYPGRWGDWQTKNPAAVGMNPDRLKQAVEFSQANETKQPKDVNTVLPMSIAAQPFDEIIGPVKDRGPQNGLVLRHGYIVAEWGDTSRVDMTFSVTKTYLSTIAGLAVDDGLIRDVHDPVRRYVHDGGFDSDHNAKITWHHLLNQTSEWEGTLWTKPDWAPAWTGKMRQRQTPGSHYEYNDVRVNRLALALLQVWRRPLPQVLRERIMDPINASPTWRWHGYNNSWVEIDGSKMQSVSGGGHWGGGMWISARDHARFGLLFLRGGKWNDRQLISPAWIDRARTPTDVQTDYGYMNWFLNTDRKRYPSAPESCYAFLGAGTNIIWVDPDHDLVAVIRWIEGSAIDPFLAHLLGAIP